MNHNLKYFILFVLVSSAGYSAPFLDKNSYWQCITKDSNDQQWSARSGYKKVALNSAFVSCKKESQKPATCKASLANCEGFFQGISIKPMWRCTALDEIAEPWQSNFYPQRDDAALAAKAYCKEKSTIPDTCYINLVTCMNYNEGARM